MRNLIRLLQYVSNTNGGATLENFIEDHEPVGNMLWQQLRRGLYVYEDMEGHIRLTETGRQELAAAPGVEVDRG